MKRRTAIKQALIFAGGLALLPSCMREQGKSSVKLNHLDISADEEDFLAEVCETLIPKAGTMGAKDLNLHLFVLKMVDDCHSPDDQKQFKTGIGNLDERCEKENGKKFAACTPEQRTAFLKKISEEKEQKGELYTAYSILKWRTIQGFMNSKYVMTDLKKYELVPGRYNGYFPVKSA
ncbi:MAG: gluconate 2-dehydrogenase subunit 3 family protein [Mucilaginibacter polytrichastri]|nr:gluconate 2-dehydrogenase subunit 3 family protein [Mucilaginibacter polytrichastri]